MNKHFFKHYMTTEPQTMEQKYIFLVDNENLAMNIVASGYQAIALISGSEAYYSVYSFIEYMEKIAFAGTYRSDYCYIPASSVKKINDTLEGYFKQEYLQFHIGWMLFKNKDYLQKMHNQAELKAILSGFILRFEGKLTEQPDLNRFHKFNEQGKRIGVLDMEIVDYLMQTVPFFVIGSIPYIYNHGCYQEDFNGIILKSHTQTSHLNKCLCPLKIQ